MKAYPPIERERAREIVRGFSGAPVMIVGDVMLDQFLIGRVERISPEAPVPVVAFDRDEYRVGGAANVAHNARALGGGVELVGLVGQDEAGGRLRAEVSALGIGAGGLVTDASRGTTRKLRIVTSRNQQVARVDYENDVEAEGEAEAALIQQAERLMATSRVVVVSDYLKGAITRKLVARIVAAGQAQGVPVLVDPKIPHIDYYRGTTLVTPNHHEAEVAAHVRIRCDEDACRAGSIFRQRAGCSNVLITRGEQGMSLVTDSSARHFPAVAREVSDVTGAGDTVIATLALSLAAGAGLAEAVWLANQAAGVVVGRFGPATLTQQELLGE
jgi:D-glycero-beta-D-manno-heptose-7-phosphate kinase